MAAPAKFGYIVYWDTNDRKERRYQGIKHPIITLIAWFSFTGNSLRPGSNENVVVFKTKELLTLREKLTSRDKVRPVKAFLFSFCSLFF